MAESSASPGESRHLLPIANAKPLVRWWWLSGPFIEGDIVRQLEWVRDQGFGGVELAWLAPRWLEEDASDRDRPPWLGQRWRALVTFTKEQAAHLDLRCDFTFGSVWPFGGSWLAAADTSQTFSGPSSQRVHGTWEDLEGQGVPVLNHLSSQALRHYAEPLLTALRGALSGAPSALFCDSLELHTGRLWSPELASQFRDRFGYDLASYMRDLDSHGDVRYDYRKFIASVILREFYGAFTSLCRENGGYSRVQCHGAPTDLLAAYAAADIPESESLLFPPAFSRIAASAAAWAGKPIVSAEAFTCIYGFPGREPVADELWQCEDVRDLKLLADALFAHGVNQLVWHGMPYQPAQKDEIEFYASVHVAANSPFTPYLRELNRYFEQVCSLMRAGQPHTGIAVYLPWEDALQQHSLPPQSRTPGANYVWEMRHASIPPELEGCAPLWVSAPFLRDAHVSGNAICSRNVSVQALYVDCKWLDFETLEQITRLLRAGAIVIWKHPATREPGRAQHVAYQETLRFVTQHARSHIGETSVVPLLTGSDLPPFWARRVGNDLLIFVANPFTRAIAYPMPHQFASQAAETALRPVTLRWATRETSLVLRFEPYQSILLRITSDGAAEQLPIAWHFSGVLSEHLNQAAAHKLSESGGFEV